MDSPLDRFDAYLVFKQAMQCLSTFTSLSRSLLIISELGLKSQNEILYTELTATLTADSTEQLNIIAAEANRRESSA